MIPPRESEKPKLHFFSCLIISLFLSKYLFVSINSSTVSILYLDHSIPLGYRRRNELKHKLLKFDNLLYHIGPRQRVWSNFYLWKRKLVKKAHYFSKKKKRKEKRRHKIEEATGATRVPRNHDDLDSLATRPNILYWSITGIVWLNAETGLPLVGWCDSRFKELTLHFPSFQPWLALTISNYFT